MWSVVLYFLLSIVSILLFFRFYIRTLAKRCKSYACLVGKTIIVTGANKGIGFYAALDFAKRGAHVILACRNEQRAQKAKETIIKVTGNLNITVKIVDLLSLDSVRSFCTDINENFDKIDVLVNNAGVVYFGGKQTKDGLDMTWQTNYFAPFLLTVLLLGKLKKSRFGRIVNVASILAKSSNINLQTVNKFDMKLAYTWTKQANILFTRELARRLNGSQVCVYALHPGAVNTDICGNLPRVFVIVWRQITKFIYKTPEEGAQTTIYCSVAKECENVSGKLYAECEEIQMYDSCKDLNFCAALWQKTIEILKLHPKECI